VTKEEFILSLFKAGQYYCTPDGQVWSNWRRGRSTDTSLKGNFIKACGYLSVTLCGDGRQERHTIHRVMWLYFHGAIPEGLQINHKDFCKTNNELANLELVTPYQNIQHAVRAGRMQAPRPNSNKAKLSDDAIRVIQHLREDGIPLWELAAHFKVSHPTIILALRTRYSVISRQSFS
jgi:hypothetical protein